MTASPSKARRRMCFLFIILFMAFGFLLAVPAPDADETLSKVGSHSEEVRQIQEDGRAKRAAAEEELGRIEGELKQKLLELKG